MDASGVPRDSFLNENNFWIGSIQFCQEIENRKPLKLNYNKILKLPVDNNTFPPYSLSFVVAYVKSNNITLKQYFPMAQQVS